MKRRLIAVFASALLGTSGLALAHDTERDASAPSGPEILNSTSEPSESATLPSASTSEQSSADVTVLERYDSSRGSSDVTSMPGVNPSYGQESMPSQSASDSSQPATESPSLYPPSTSE